MPTLQDWWSAIYSEPPENATHDLKKNVIQLSGQVNDVFAMLVRDPLRFHLRQFGANLSVGPPIPNALPAFEEALPTFQESAIRWLKLPDGPPLYRLAFGAVLLLPVDSLEFGYNKLDEYLPGVEVSPNTSDFLYQINRARMSSALSGLRLNRLSKWSCQRVHEMIISGDGAVSPPSPPDVFACRVELDMNSVPLDSQLEKDNLPSLFRELVCLAKEIACGGDIP